MKQFCHRLSRPALFAGAMPLSVMVVGASHAAAAADQKLLPVALVDALNKVAGGSHKGYRANHAKGIRVEGTFTPAEAASTLSKAPHFANTVPVVVRFSDTTGVPTMPDASPDASPHGMAIRFYSQRIQ